MKSLIQKYYSGTFQEALKSAANRHVDKLDFNTREEYFLWVKQWKEDYNNITKLVRIEKLNSKLHSGSTPLPTTVEKVGLAIEKIKTEMDFNTGMSRSLVLQQQLSSQYGLNFYGRCSMRTIAIYLLVVRAASKIRAGQKMKERLEAQKVAV